MQARVGNNWYLHQHMGWCASIACIPVPVLAVSQVVGCSACLLQTQPWQQPQQRSICVARHIMCMSPVHDAHVSRIMLMSSSSAVLFYREPDLTRDLPGLHALHVPSQLGNSLPEREKVRRRPPVAKLHCKAFQFPVSQNLLTAVGVHVCLTACLTAYLATAHLSI